MKEITIALLMGALASSATAMSRQESSLMSCAVLHQVLAKDGAMVLRHYSGQVRKIEVYDRYVTNSMSCAGQGRMSATTVPTSDNLECPVAFCNAVTGRGPSRSRAQ